MSYTKPPIELIARRGYSSMGQTDSTQMVKVAADQPWAWKDGKCIDSRSGAIISDDACTAYMAKPSAGEPGGGETIWQKAMRGAFGAPGPAQTQQTAAQTSMMPSWILPAAVGGGALVLLLVLRKKR
jgi:hypothetical protein